MKTFLRWIYAVLAYALVTAALTFGLRSFVGNSGLYPNELISLLSSSGLNLWVGEITTLILLMGAVSFLTYCLWNLLMWDKLLGRRPGNDKHARILNWILTLLVHPLLLLLTFYYRLGSVIRSFFLSLLNGGELLAYCLPFLAYCLLFFFVSRILSPVTCYVFKHMWKARRSIGLY